MLEQKSSSLENIQYMQQSSLSYYRLRPLFYFWSKLLLEKVSYVYNIPWKTQTTQKIKYLEFYSPPWKMLNPCISTPLMREPPRYKKGTCISEITRMLALQWYIATKVSIDVLHPPIFACWHPHYLIYWTEGVAEWST